MNTLRVDYERLTALGWTLNIVSWISIVLSFFSAGFGATGAFPIACAVVFLASMLAFAILDYASNAIHRPKPSKLTSLADELEESFNRRRNDA